MPASSWIDGNVVLPLLGNDGLSGGRENQVLPGSKVFIRGKATGKGKIGSVTYRINGGALLKAKVESGFSAEWSFTADLKRGKNVITIQATDNFGNKSRVETLTVVRPKKKPASLLLAGE